MLLLFGLVCDSRWDHRLRGVWFKTFTRKVGTPLHALQISSDASCSSKVDAYQRVFPPSHAWFKATTKASRHRCLPGQESHAHKRTDRYKRKSLQA